MPWRFAAAERVELGRCALIPAFADTHQHFASFSAFNAGLNVMEAESNGEILAMVDAFAEKCPGKTLIAFGASPYSVEEGRLLSRLHLYRDRLRADRPVRPGLCVEIGHLH